MNLFDKKIPCPINGELNRSNKRIKNKRQRPKKMTTLSEQCFKVLKDPKKVGYYIVPPPPIRPFSNPEFLQYKVGVKNVGGRGVLLSLLIID